MDSSGAARQVIMGIRPEHFEDAAAHGIGVGIAGLSPDQHDIAFDRAIFRLKRLRESLRR